MQVRNVHERVLSAPLPRVGALIDGLASAQDGLWPRHLWPPMRLDRPLAVGAAGGHGPVRYVVEAYEPGREVRFRFTGPRGFVGGHRLEAVAHPAGGVRLRHTLEMRIRGAARLTWPLVFRPLHDALLEDAFERAETGLGLPPRRTPWSPWVQLLRRLLGTRRPRRRSTGL